MFSCVRGKRRIFALESLEKILNESNFEYTIDVAL